MRAQKEVPKRKRKLRKPVIFILILIPIPGELVNLKCSTSAIKLVKTLKLS